MWHVRDPHRCVRTGPGTSVVHKRTPTLRRESLRLGGFQVYLPDPTVTSGLESCSVVGPHSSSIDSRTTRTGDHDLSGTGIVGLAPVPTDVCRPDLRLRTVRVRLDSEARGHHHSPRLLLFKRGCARSGSGRDDGPDGEGCRYVFR